MKPLAFAAWTLIGVAAGTLLAGRLGVRLEVGAAVGGGLFAATWFGMW